MLLFKVDELELSEELELVSGNPVDSLLLELDELLELEDELLLLVLLLV